jgi:putative transcriptional regulator
VVYHKPSEVDPLAVKLAEREKIPLVVTTLSLPSLRKKLATIAKG